jgi:hypothetical protein
MESAARSLMCWRSDAVSIACAAAATAGEVAVVSVNAAERDEVDEPLVAEDLSPSVAHAATTNAARTAMIRGEKGTVRGCRRGW